MFRNVCTGCGAPPSASARAFSGLDLITDISHVGDDLHHVIHCSSLGRQQPFDFVIGIPALARKVSEMTDGSAPAAFIFRADPRKEKHFSWVGDRYHF
jgi:hypothetical protein